VERELQRTKEQEPHQQEFSIEERILRLSKERERRAKLPHVFHYKEMPWQESVQVWAGKHYIGADPQDRLRTAPICTIALSEQIVPPGGRNGRHRHVREAMFYVIEGHGHEVHDAQHYPWEAGDIFIVPSYCDHQHFNDDQVNPARFFFTISPVVDFMGVHWVEQIETSLREYRAPPGSEPVLDKAGKVIGWKRDGEVFKLGFDQTTQHLIEGRQSIATHIDKPKDTYEKYVKQLEDEVAWRQRCPHVVHGKDVPWENTRMGKIKFMVTPETDCGLKTYDAYVQEIPPGSRSGRHRHLAEEVFKVLDGRGYDIHDGVRWDWDTEDVVCIPPWAEHQHFNGDPKRPARFVLFRSRWFNHMGHGGIQHLEDAP